MQVAAGYQLSSPLRVCSPVVVETLAMSLCVPVRRWQVVPAGTAFCQAAQRPKIIWQFWVKGSPRP